MDSIGKVGMNDARDSVSIWYAYLPFDIDREIYIQNSFRTGTITIINENGEIKHKVKIGKLAIKEIEFPIDTDNLGSEVICLTVPYSGELRVVDVYNNFSEYDYQNEKQFKLSRKNEIGSAGILIDGKGNIIASVDGDSDNGIITINVTNQNRSGKLKINVNGELSIVNDGTTLMQTTQNIKIEHLNVQQNKTTSVEVTQDLFKFTTDKFVINSDQEPMLLGQKTIDFIANWLDILASESAGPYPLLHATEYVNLKQRLNELKSIKSYLD